LARPHRIEDSAMVTQGHGYVTDIPYTRGFFRELAPAWLDFTATLAGTAPPAREDGFAWCELGCGQGVTTVMLAATHPRGRFVGIDLLPEHIDHARRFAAETDVKNVEFLAADFSDDHLGLTDFDYIVAHGVYSWVDAAVQQALRRFIARRLRPKGLVYLSYNAMPGWAADLPFQRLLYAFGRAAPGDSPARFAAALAQLRRVLACGAATLKASPIASRFDELTAGLPAAYLAHEYMGAHWQPLFVSEVRAAMAEIGLTPAGSANLIDNFDRFVLRRGEIEMLEGIEDADLRELARDFVLNARFRRDVYSRDGDRLDDDAQHARLLATRYALAGPAGAVEYVTQTNAGKLSFDNPIARKIIAALATGARAGNTLIHADVSPEDVIANLTTLCCAGAIRPVEPEDVPVQRLNGTICGRAGTSEEISFLALPGGTAVRTTTAMLRALGAPYAAPVDKANDDQLHFLQRTCL
jgi:SAM-dependent methyltransferase